MRDWQAYVRQHLPALACAPECEAEIVEEIALQLEGIHRTARAAGASEVEAFARVVDEVPDWRELASAVMASKYPRTAPIRQAALTRLEPVVARQTFGTFALTLVHELRHAARALAAAPVLTAATVLTLAVGIGATTAMFSLVNSVLLAPLPFREPARLALVQQTIPEIADRYPVLGANPRSFRAWENACRTTCRELAAMRGTTGTLTGGGEPEGLTGALISRRFFDVLGIPLLVGRGFTADEDKAGADDVVVLSHALWIRRFAGDRRVVGRSIEIDGRTTEVVGVLAPAPALPRIEHLSAVPFGSGVAEFFRPLAWTDDQLQSPGEYDVTAIVRLADGVSVTQAQAELDAITTAEFRNAPVHPMTRVRPMGDHLLAPARRPLSLLLASVVAALAIACVNVANLLGGRWLARRRELAIRSAMGATTGSLLRLVAVESGLLVLIGGAAGLVVAFAGLQTLVRLAPLAIPRLESARLDTMAFGFGVLATVVCGVVCSLLPAWHGLRQETAETLKSGAHTTANAPRASALRAWLVGAEVALTSALLVIGGLLTASLLNVLRVDPGFRTPRILAVDVTLPAARYSTAGHRARFLTELLSSVHALPGVESAGIVRVLPFEGEATVDTVAPAGDTRPVTVHPVANHLQVSPGYFGTLALPLVAGRWLAESDSGRDVALVSELTARTVWPNQNPIGQRFRRSGPKRQWEVVGVVADARLLGLDKPPGLVTYVPYWSGTASEFSLVVKTSAEPASVAGALRTAVAAIDRQMPLQNVRTMDAVLESTLAVRRFQVRLMMAFAGAGVLLACLGVYSVVSAAVERRTPEFAVRLALGATPAAIAREVLGQELQPIVAGLVLGVAGGMGGAGAVASLLFGVTPYDPAVIMGVVAMMLGVATAASFLPAVRATRTDPLLALRRV